ncbi:MAG: hypothetical protein DME19_12150 [Verrucomicrobia bacterium]|nr:MAG: hypothetical protein DME19_12150 [Verrucomicrobiota bacterium]
MSEIIQAAEASENEVKSFLTTDQQAAYANFKQEQWSANARLSANGELLLLQNEIGLTQEQQDVIFPVLYQQVLKEKTRREGGGSPTASDQEVTPRSLNEWLLQSEEQRIKGLEPVLTPSQLQKYRQILAVRRAQALSVH